MKWGRQCDKNQEVLCVCVVLGEKESERQRGIRKIWKNNQKKESEVVKDINWNWHILSYGARRKRHEHKHGVWFPNLNSRQRETLIRTFSVQCVRLCPWKVRLCNVCARTCMFDATLVAVAHPSESSAMLWCWINRLYLYNYYCYEHGFRLQQLFKCSPLRHNKTQMQTWELHSIQYSVHHRHKFSYSQHTSYTHKELLPSPSLHH